MESKEEFYLLDVSKEELSFIIALLLKEKKFPIAKILGTIEVESAKENGISAKFTEKIKKTINGIAAGSEYL